MDEKLLTWAGAVKARQARAGRYSTAAFMCSAKPTVMPGLDPGIHAARLVASCPPPHDSVPVPSGERPPGALDSRIKPSPSVSAWQKRLPTLPPLWIFTDWHRLPDPTALIRHLPPGLCGVVYRPAAAAAASELPRLRRVCRARRVALSVAGPVGAPGCGEHRPGGRRQLRRVGAQFATASAHGVAELVRAQRSGAALVFLSPMFPTESHPGAPALGVLRWAAMAHRRRVPVLALGGLNGTRAARLPRFIAGAAVVGAALVGAAGSRASA